MKRPKSTLFLLAQLLSRWTGASGSLKILLGPSSRKYTRPLKASLNLLSWKFKEIQNRSPAWPSRTSLLEAERVLFKKAASSNLNPNRHISSLRRNNGDVEDRNANARKHHQVKFFLWSSFGTAFQLRDCRQLWSHTATSRCAVSKYTFTID